MTTAISSENAMYFLGDKLTNVKDAGTDVISSWNMLNVTNIQTLKIAACALLKTFACHSWQKNIEKTGDLYIHSDSYLFQGSKGMLEFFKEISGGSNELEWFLGKYVVFFIVTWLTCGLLIKCDAPNVRLFSQFFLHRMASYWLLHLWFKCCL